MHMMPGLLRLVLLINERDAIPHKMMADGSVQYDMYQLREREYEDPRTMKLSFDVIYTQERLSVL